MLHQFQQHSPYQVDLRLVKYVADCLTAYQICRYLFKRNIRCISETTFLRRTLDCLYARPRHLPLQIDLRFVKYVAECRTARQIRRHLIEYVIRCTFETTFLRRTLSCSLYWLPNTLNPALNRMFKHNKPRP